MREASAFLQDLSGWDVSSVTNHAEFANASPMATAPGYWPAFGS